MTAIGTGQEIALPVARSDRLHAGLVRLVRGDAADPPWVRASLAAILALATFLYVWQLDISGYANEYYAAAAQAGSQSWGAYFFGSFDAAGFITVDKPPAALWLIGLSVRLFGLSSWSILLPQAILGVATVGLVYLAARRSFGPAAGVVAALVMALTPVAAVIFRYDNPDALLTFLCVLAAWSLLRGIETGRTRWVLAAAAVVGLAFDTKYLQAFMVVPAFALTFLIAGRPSWRRRIAELVAAGIVLLLSSGWWIAIVGLIPAGSRPYIGGSQTNSVLDLMLGYDGLGRVLGNGAGAGLGGGAGIGGGGAPGGVPGGFGGASGPLRMFNEQWGGQIGWLIPAAAIATIGGILARWRAPRTDSARVGFILWGGWLATHVVVFSLSAGNLHPYYSVVLGPAVAALVGGGLAEWWRARARWPLIPDAVLAVAIATTAAVAYALLARSPDFAAGLGTAILVVGLGATVAVLLSSRLPSARRVALVGAGLGLVVGLAGPAAYVWQTIGTPLAGGDPVAGPALASDQGPGGFAPIGAAGGPGGGLVAPDDGTLAGPGGSALPGTGLGGRSGAGMSGGAPGVDDAALIDYLGANRGSTRWLVAVESANAAAGIQLATGEPVMAMGGFSGSDPAPTADELAAYVASGELRYVYLVSAGPGGFAPGIGGLPPGALGVPGAPGDAFTPPAGLGGGPSRLGGVGVAAGRLAWVAADCSAVDFGGWGGTLYDCAVPPEASVTTTGG